MDEGVYAELKLAAPTNPLSEKECLERGVFTMINEAALALIEDRIVSHRVDLAMIMGTGFPPFRGGLLKYADSLGLSTSLPNSKCMHHDLASDCSRRLP